MMYKFIFLYFILFSSLGVLGQRTCLTTVKTQELINADEKFAEHHREVMDFIQNPSNQHTYLSKNMVTEVVVPIVVHVLYKNSTQNISDEQIESQLEVLNQDFRKLNSDFSTVVPLAYQTYGSDMEVTFCLATKTPQGAVTTGIIRKQVPSNFSFGDDYYTSSGDPAWNPDKYLNIWIGIMDGEYNGILGWAYLPDSAGLPFDGLAIDYRYFGTIGTATNPYDKGRTATHEIGHYFGLLHPWGDDGSSCGSAANSDGVADTPATNNPYYDCPVFPDYSHACSLTGNAPMFMNYMDYVDDACMAFFTNDQKTILQNTLSSYRSGLINSAETYCSTTTEETEIIIYPNPPSTEFYISSPYITIDEIHIFNSYGVLVKNITVTVGSPINVSDLDTGIYFLRMYSEGKPIKTYKIIKQ